LDAFAAVAIQTFEITPILTCNGMINGSFNRAPMFAILT